MFLALRRNPSSPLLIESLKRLPDQIKSVMDDFNAERGSFSADDIDAVVVNGMGGSNLGAYIIQSVFKNKLKIPFMVEPGYDVPAYIHKKTLYIVSSYSGTTEEPIAAYKTAKRRGAKIIIITSDTDNTLTNIAKRDHVAHYFFETKANPSGQPRLGLGYGIASLLGLFRKLGLISVTNQEISNIISQLKRKNIALNKTGNEAQKLAKKLADHEIIYISGQLFEGNLRVMRNQSCETAKNFSSYLVLSDMNHYSLEGLSHPRTNRKRLAAVYIESDAYDKKIKRRLELTKEVMKKQDIAVHSYTPSGKTALAQSFDILQFGSWFTYYLSLINKVDPLSVPWVDWFKKNL